MKRIMPLLALVIILTALFGCVNRRVKDDIHLQRVVLEQYVNKINDTTAEQDKAALKAQLRNWQAIDHYFNGVIQETGK